MEVYSRKLVSHAYDEKRLLAIYSTNCIKAKGNCFEEENCKKLPKELQSADFVYSIQNINNPNDEYGFCYGTECQLPSGNFCYTVAAFILDSNLPESIVKEFASSVAESLYRSNRIVDEDWLRTDRLWGFKNYPLSYAHISNTVESFSNNIVDLFKSAKKGLAFIDLSKEQQIKAIAKKRIKETE